MDNICVEVAQEASLVVNNPADYVQILQKIQELRMIGNAAITYDDINLHYHDVFVDE